MSDLILVTGATGFIGQSVVRSLLRHGYRVRALTRANSSWPFEAHTQLERAEGDMCNEDSVMRAMNGVTKVIHLAAAKNDEARSGDINTGGAQILISAAQKAGVHRIINISTQSAKLPQRGAYGETKRQADKLFHASGIPVVTLRCSLVYGDAESGVFGTIVKYSALPVIPLIGPGTCRFRPIHRDDLAEIICTALTTPHSTGKLYDAGGPDLLSLNEVTAKIMDARGVRRPVIHIPGWFGLLAARILSVLPHPPLTISNVLGSIADVPMDTKPMLRDFDHPAMRTFDEGLRELFGTPSKISASDAEAEALLSYVLSAVMHYKPTADECALYRSAITAHGLSGQSIDPALLRSHLLLGAADCATKIRYPHSVLRRKILIAAAVAETQPSSAEALLPRNQSAFRILCITILMLLRAAFTMLTAIPLLFSSRLKRYAGTI